MGNGVSGLELLPLWPSLFLQQSLADHEEWTRRLESLARERAGEDVFSIDDESIEWLKANLVYGVSAYLREAGFTQPPGCSFSGRFDVQRFGELASAEG